MLNRPEAVLVGPMGLLVLEETLSALEAVVVVFGVMAGGIAGVCTGVASVTGISTTVLGWKFELSFETFSAPFWAAAVGAVAVFAVINVNVAAFEN